MKHEKRTFGNHLYYQKIERFGSDELKHTLKRFIAFINERNENERLEGIYNRGKKRKNEQNEIRRLR